MAKKNSIPMISPQSSPNTPLGATINSLHAQSPILAADAVMEAFLHPPRLKPKPTEQALLDVAQTSTLTICNAPIKVYTWSPVLPSNTHTILLTHGYGTAASSMLSFIPPLLAAGCKVVACDHIAHGSSGGDWGDLKVFKETFLTLARQYAPIEAVIGHSVGATMVLVGLVENPDVKVNEVVCLAPPTQFETVIEKYCDLLGVSSELGVLAQERMEESVVVLPWIVRKVTEKRKLDVGRVLVVQDEDDNVVTMEDARCLEQAFADARLEITKGNGHYRGLRNPKVIKFVTEFVLDGMNSGSKL